MAANGVVLTPASFRAWRVRLYGERGITAAAKALGCSKTSVLAWERGYIIESYPGCERKEERKIPKYIALACQALANGLPPMS
jgi:hypothetical protein